MAVRIEMQNTGDARVRGKIVAILEHVLSDRPGEWRVFIVGSHANDDWEMKVEGPAGFERSYTLVGDAGEHQPAAIGNLVVKLLPARKA
jgi:hypothetical protein